MNSVAFAALQALWRDAALPAAALDFVELPGREPVLPSSFAVATAVQASLAAAALAAAEIWQQRGSNPRQRVSVDAADAVRESSCWFTLDGVMPPVWDKLSGLYRCADGPVRIHANFAHHRDGALRLLGLPPGSGTERDAVAQALAGWRAEDFEQAAADAGLVVAAVRSFEAWQRHAQATAVAADPVVAIEKIGEAPPRAWPAATRPLGGLRVLDLTRILAGPAAARTLAAYGADVLMINSPRLPNIDAIAELSRGKRSAQLDLADAAGAARLRELLASAHVFLQGYRPGALAARGFAPADAARLSPGIVCASLSAYGSQGPWAGRRGFDSLVQSATGFNADEAAAAGSAEPKALPIQALDYSAGFLLAFGIQAALLRQAREGGSWHVRVSLAGAGRWLRGLGRVEGAFGVQRPAFGAEHLETTDTGFGRLVAVRHAAQLAATPARYERLAAPPGSAAPAW
jgi:crotonobetainyl-CoA:carnitine CoA-transferase CaiB-like acyl-CoA transferase